MADKNQDVPMQDNQPQEAREDKIITEQQDMDQDLDADKLRSTLNNYKFDVIKDQNVDLETIVADLRQTLDRLDQGKLPEHFEGLVASFIGVWSKRKFHKIEINYQAIVNGFFQYWMFKRAKKEKLNLENLKTLRLLLNDDAYFYSIQFTREVMKEAKEEIEAVSKVNPVIFTHIDDFTDVKRSIYSPFFAANVEAFCKLDGFAEIIKTLETASDMSIDQLREFFDICISTAPYLKEDFKTQIFTVLVDKILELFRNFSDEKLKTISQDNLEKFIN